MQRVQGVKGAWVQGVNAQRYTREQVDKNRNDIETNKMCLEVSTRLYCC